MTNEQYTVLVDDNNKLVFPTAEELVSSNNLLPSNNIKGWYIKKHL